jgi:hypothetical protein
MKGQTLLKAILLMVALTILTSPVLAQPPASAQRRGMYMYGDWLFKVDFNGREMTSILTFSRDEEGNRIAYMINFWGMTKLQDLKYEEGELSFVQVNRFGDNEFKSTFTGKIEEGKLTGTLSSDRGETKVTGERAPRLPRAAGIWDMTLKMGEREFISKLTITQNKEGELVGKWESRRGETEVTDLTYELGTITFKRTSTYQGNERQSTFEGEIDRETDTLNGTMKSERGEITVTGKRVGGPVIGTWNLETTREGGSPRQQRLVVNRDLTGLYGAMSIKQVNFEDGKVTFKIVLQFGENPFEMNFAGKIDDEGKLTGEMTTSRGTSKITGKKVVRTFRRRPSTGR